MSRKNPAAVMIRTTDDVLARINKEAAKRGMSQSEFVRQLLIEAMDNLVEYVPAPLLRTNNGQKEAL